MMNDRVTTNISTTANRLRVRTYDNLTVLRAGFTRIYYQRVGHAVNKSPITRFISDSDWPAVGLLPHRAAALLVTIQGWNGI
ncbi:hypothetical protein Y032_0043g814 [Ancylostoma ceylanicum]|uniref:Uncharacterized protein n=1 Tax=Ancylostoma ceylanicum TaxID=53326 RepID=A0A016UFI3_9BILA|nr:hypothetical protein Y032_0043g814 [Ancylostoma ceylanicum]